MNLANALVHHLLGRNALLIGLACRFGSTLGAHRHFIGRSGHLVDRRGDLIGLAALVGHGLLRTLRLAGHGRDQTGQLGGGAGHLLYQRMDLLDEAIERGGQLTQLVLAGDRQAVRQVTVTLRHIVEVLLDLQQWTQDGIAHQYREPGHQHQQQQRGAEHDHRQAVDTRLENRAGLDHIALDVVEVQRGAERQVPLRQVFGVTDLGHQRIAARHREAVVDEMAAILTGLDQFTDGIHAIRVLKIGEALADALVGVTLEHAQELAIVAPEITFAAVGQPLEQRHGLSPRLQIALGRALVNRRNRIACQLHVVLELGPAITNEAGTGLCFLLIGQVLQLDHGDAAEQDREEQDRTKGKQQQLHSQT